jgi:hypothetical protein
VLPELASLLRERELRNLACSVRVAFLALTIRILSRSACRKLALSGEPATKEAMAGALHAIVETWRKVTAFFAGPTGRVRLVALGVGVGAFAGVAFFASRTSLVAAAGTGGVLGLFFTLGATLLLGTHLVWRRREKGTSRLALAAVVGAVLAMVSSSGVARLSHQEAEDLQISDVAFAEGERETRIEEARSRAKAASWLGTLATLPALGALAALVVALGERREQVPLSPHAAKYLPRGHASTAPAVEAQPQEASSPPTPPKLPLRVLWTAFFASVASVLIALVHSISQAVRG